MSESKKPLFGNKTRWTTKELVTKLEKFCQSPAGAAAKVSLAVPMGFAEGQTSFDIRKIDLVPNTIVGSPEKYRLIIIVQ